MKLAIISSGGKSSQMVLKEAKAFFDIAKPINIKDIEVHTSSQNSEILYKGKLLEEYDCVYIRGSHKHMLLERSIAESLGKNVYMPLTPASFTLSHNKFLTILELQKASVPIPKTYLAATTSSAKALIKQIKYPVIMKLPSGTQGKGVMFADSVASANSILDTLEVFNQPYIIQEFIETALKGATDIRAIVVGDKVVASMKRKAVDDELRANIHMGGVGIPYELDNETKKIAIKSAKAVGAQICAIDILESTKPLVIEVNISPGLEGITKATKLNVAKELAKYLYEQTKIFHQDKKTEEYKTIIEDLNSSTRPIDDGKIKEIFTNLNIKAGIIKLPKIVTQITGFNEDEEVILIANKGHLEIKKHKIKK